MPTITDPEFGEITVTRRALASRVSLRIAPNGRIRITMPLHAPLASAKLLVKQSRRSIHQLITEQQGDFPYGTPQQIGKSHNLLVEQGAPAVKTIGTTIIVSVTDEQDFTDPIFQQSIRDHVVKALRKEAKSYLPRRLKFLAEQHGFRYDKIRLTHSSSRWGSCSSNGTISLNIALMNLPFELLDYVLIHELCHTRQMNHSQAFWCEVAAINPRYKQHRTTLKKYTPHV